MFIGCCLSFYSTTRTVSECEQCVRVYRNVAEGWLTGTPNWKQKDPDDLADELTQPANPTSVGLQQKVRLVLVVHSVLGAHVWVSLTWLLYHKDSHTMKCRVCTQVICGYAPTVKHTKKTSVLASVNFQHSALTRGRRRKRKEETSRTYIYIHIYIYI